MKHSFPETKSAHVAGLDYSEETKILNVHFKGGRSYSHMNVPQEAVDNFIRYRSPGEFYHGVIKKYRMVK